MLPARVRRASAPLEEESTRWAVRLFLRRPRLISPFLREITHVADEVQPLDVEGHTLHGLREDLPLLDLTAASTPARTPRLLAPLAVRDAVRDAVRERERFFAAPAADGGA